MKKIEQGIFDAERAFYGEDGLQLFGCSFDGPADGESALKECKNVTAKNCFFNLRYPFWHDEVVTIEESEMTELCRAALWYSKDIAIKSSKLHGIKALRECENVVIENCDVVSPEFGWSTRNLRVENTTATSEYFMLRAENLQFKNVQFKGKYSFQYVKNATFEDCRFDTKDAFWHSENVTVKNCVVKGEYLAWYAKNLTLIDCKIIGTQPLCYCEGLKLINCQMEGTDLSFEKSDVIATVTSPIDSVKNPKSGKITAPSVGEIIFDDPNAKGEVVVG